MQEKTNVQRILDKNKINYNSYTYECEKAISGVEVANILNIEVNRVFKTLVCTSKSKQNYVFVLPVAKELDLKKAANTVGEKSIQMLKSKELLPLTGYVHGGCSPIGMKKFFKTTIDISAKEHERIVFSAGKIGHQVEMSPEELIKLIDFDYADICVE